MKVSSEQLNRIILEEVQKALKEVNPVPTPTSRVVKPTEGTPEALRKSREKGRAKADAENKKIDDDCNASIAAIGGGGENDPMPNETEMACLKNRDACKERCIRCRHKGDWMSAKSKC